MIRKVAGALALTLVGVIAFDVVAFLAFPHVVQKIEPEYANDIGPDLWRSMRLQTPYQGSESRGFDIKPGDRSIVWHPPEIPPYEIWGNSVGCFDDEPPAGIAPDIYLAGDSFTWGYAPYETKFGTVLERETDLLVYACGVPHTGQQHQFDKFLEVAQSFPGWPSLVIVNVYTNDIANDHAFPHTIVVEGTTYEDKHLHEEVDELDVVPVTREERLAASGDFRYYVKTYSASANIIYEVIKNIRGTSALGRDFLSDLYDMHTFPIRSDVAAEHRDIIRRWIEHSEQNEYDIRFALIPHMDDFGRNIYAEYMEFIREIGGVAWDFESYVRSKDLDPKELFWRIDPHFDPRGNAVYAEFLLEMLEAEARAGTLALRHGRAGASPAASQESRLDDSSSE